MNTVQEVIDAYLLLLRVRVDAGDITPARLDVATRYLTEFARRFGAKPLTEAKRHDLTVFIAEHPAWKSGHTKTHAVGAVLTCFRCAEDEEWIDHNPYQRKPRSLRFTCPPRQPMPMGHYVGIMRAAMHRAGDAWTTSGDETFLSLRHGPYAAPVCRVGDTLPCAVWGLVRVDGFSNGRRPWPYSQKRRGGGPRAPRHLIVTAGLLEALHQEQACAIAHGWGVSLPTIFTWRKALGIRGLSCHQRRYMRQRRLNRASGRALRRMLFFLRRTGARTSEARAMRWADIDWQASVVRLLEHKTAHAIGDVRLIGLDPCVLRLLRNMRRQRGDVPDSAHVFLNGRGRPWLKSAFTTLLRNYARRAGLNGPISAYALRHLFAVTGIENGVSEKAVADQLGHADPKMLYRVYARQTRRNAAHLQNVVADVLRRPRPGTKPDKS